MILDAIVAIIIISTMVQGYRHGLLHTIIRTVGWLAAIIAGFFFAPKFNEFLMDNTNLYDSIYTNINEKVSTTLSPETFQDGLPTIIHDTYLNVTGTVSDSIASALAALLFTVLGFVVISLVVRMFFHILLSLFSKRHNSGISGFFDGLTGMLFGFLKGLLYVFLFLAVMLPAASLIKPDALGFLMENLQSSFVAFDLYNNNLIMLIIGDLL